MAKIIPNGLQQFFDADGVPLAGGHVYMYVPSSTTPKDTWQEAGETTLNSTPIDLDSAGRALIYGNGVYRQVVQDVNLVGIWDLEVSVFETSPVLWGGTATGTANNLSVDLVNGDLAIESGNPVAGQVVCFVAGATNDGPAQVTVTWPGPETNGPKELVKDTYLGPAPLEGGEIVVGNLVQMTYDDASGDWFVLNAVPVGTVFVPACFSIDQPLPDMNCVLVLLRTYTLLADAPGSYAYAEVLPSADVEISIRKNDTEIGTVTFTDASNVGTIVMDTEVSFAATDRLVLDFPTDLDETLGSIGISFKLSRDLNG
jgi:hypothetical protein